MKNFGILFPIFFLLSCNNQNEEDRLNEFPLTIEAEYMQYACGDWVDDMQVLKIDDTLYNFLLGKDIDPLFLDGAKEIGELFYKNKTNNFGLKFRLKGFVSSCAVDGCDGDSPKFWMTEIEKLDGSNFSK